MATATRLPGSEAIHNGNLVAAEDLRTAQYTFVTINSSGQLAQSNAGDRTYGVLQNQPNTGEPCDVITRGPSLLKVDGNAGAIDENASLKPDNSGQGVATTTGADIIGARALEGSTAAGDIVTVEVVEAKPYG